MDELDQTIKNLMPVLKEKLKNSEGTEKEVIEKSIRAFELVQSGEKTPELAMELSFILVELQKMKV